MHVSPLLENYNSINVKLPKCLSGWRGLARNRPYFCTDAVCAEKDVLRARTVVSASPGT